MKVNNMLAYFLHHDEVLNVKTICYNHHVLKNSDS